MFLEKVINRTEGTITRSVEESKSRGMELEDICVYPAQDLLYVIIVATKMFIVSQ